MPRSCPNRFRRKLKLIHKAAQRAANGKQWIYWWKEYHKTANKELAPLGYSIDSGSILDIINSSRVRGSAMARIGRAHLKRGALANLYRVAASTTPHLVGTTEGQPSPKLSDAQKIEEFRKLAKEFSDNFFCSPESRHVFQKCAEKIQEILKK